MSTMTRRTMSGADAMWLHADRPNHLMVIDGIMWTEEPLDHDRFRATIQERLVDVYPVFSQRPVEPTRPWDMPALGGRPGLLAVPPPAPRPAAQARRRQAAAGLPPEAGEPSVRPQPTRCGRPG